MIRGPPEPPTPQPKPLKRTRTHIFSMNHGPPAYPHPIAHTLKMPGDRLIFNDSWAARAAHHTAETMKSSNFK